MTLDHCRKVWQIEKHHRQNQSIITAVINDSRFMTKQFQFITDFTRCMIITSYQTFNSIMNNYSKIKLNTSDEKVSTHYSVNFLGSTYLGKTT